MEEEKEIKKLRNEAAKYRTQLAPYKRAFQNLEPEAIDWLLYSVELLSSDPSQAGERFATLGYGNMGDDKFKEWTTNVVGINLEENATNEEKEDIEMVSNEDYQAQQGEVEPDFEARVMGAIQALDQKIEHRAQEATRQKQFTVINDKVRSLGYDPDTWQGMMLFQVISVDVSADQDLEARLDAAHTIVTERIGEQAPTETVQIGDAQVSDEPLNVPATGGQVGGGGIPNVNEDTPMSFGDADEALMNLMRSQIGQ
mgnify:CR=1 FL=1